MNEGVSREDKKEDDVWLRANWCSWPFVAGTKGRLGVTECALGRGSKLFDNRKEKKGGGFENKGPIRKVISY